VPIALKSFRPVSATDRKTDARGHWFFRVAGACAFVVVAIFLFQEVVLRVAPGPATTDEWLAIPISAIERVRMALMFSLFFFSLTTYAGVAFRLDDPAARTGLFFGTIGSIIELAYRAVEMRALPQWADAYRQAQDPALRAILRARVDTFHDVTASLYIVIRGTALCTNLFFAGALRRSEGLERAIQLLFLANAARLGMNYLKPLASGLEPVLDWMFILVLAPLYGSLGVWLRRSEGGAST
jgi:hypothetical protein